jgi:hypothetical protein
MGSRIAAKSADVAPAGRIDPLAGLGRSMAGFGRRTTRILRAFRAPGGTLIGINTL